VSDDARNENFPVGHLHFLPVLPLVLVTGIGSLEQIRLRTDLHHDVRHMPERHVVHELAVVDDVDPRIGLLANHFGDRLVKKARECRIGGPPIRPGHHRLGQRFGPLQPADVRRQDAIGAAFHCG
jgi:hypothetical protein